MGPTDDGNRASDAFQEITAEDPRIVFPIYPDSNNVELCIPGPVRGAIAWGSWALLVLLALVLPLLR
ncbi:hypothetical protein ABCS02_33455 [Microbacterium sp. X-17]|uniref:hypothetical protein n=1 Tax=Microbacterium sp. X-17 TaxID=3144404 RepID=UPI0031F578AC